MSNCIAVIVVHNSELRITSLLDSLLNQTKKFYKIIIVDNNSTDETCSIIASFNRDDIELFELGENTGGAGGFNLGMRVAFDNMPDFIVTFDDDALPLQKNYLELLVNFSIEKDCKVVAPLVLDEDDFRQTAYSYKTDKAKTNDVSLLQRKDNITDIKLFNGVLFNKEVVDICGFPNPDFFIRGDEEDYKQRVIRANFTVSVNTNALVSHPLSSNEYITWRTHRYHYISHAGKNYFSTRNRIYLLSRKGDIDLTRKFLLLSKNLQRYIFFYLVYRNADFRGLSVWITAFCDGIFGNLKGKYFKIYRKGFDAK